MKPKYKLNPETLTYEKIGSDSAIKWKNALWVVLSGIGFGFLFIIMTAYLFPSPHKRQMRNDLNVLEKNYDELNLKLEQSIVMYESLLEKEKQLQQLTFEAEIMELQNIAEEMKMYSPDFDFGALLNITNSKISNASKSGDNLISKIETLLDIAYGKQMFISSVPSSLPLKKGEFVIVSGFGERIHPMFKTMRQHNGIDMAARQGTPVIATGNGKVVSPPSDLDGLGNIVAIDHGFGYISIYACLLKSEVKPGAVISRGQVIGSVGRSGIASGPHLHYEIRKDGKPINPVNYFFLSLTPIEFDEYIKKASVKNQSMS